MTISRRRRFLSVAAGVGLAAVLALTQAPTAHAQPACTITGTPGDDVVCAGDGDDFVDSGAGDDVVYAGLGVDTLIGGPGADDLFGDQDNDELFGDEGDDFLDGGLGTDDLAGEAGADELRGGDDADQIAGGDGADVARGGLGTDRVDGGAGSDDLAGDADNDWLFGGEGGDGLDGGLGNDDVQGGDGADRLSGGADNDLIRGGLGADLLRGEFGTDELDGGPDDDTLDGGNDGDTCTAEPLAGRLTSCESAPVPTPADTVAGYATDSAPEPARNVAVASAGGGFEATSLGVRVTTPASAQGAVTLTDTASPAATVGVGLPAPDQAAPAVESRDESVVYDRAGTTVDIAVQVVDGGVRLTTVQAAPPSTPDSTVRYRYPLTVPAGAGVQVDADGQVRITASSGALVAAVAPPWAQDARGVDLPTRYEVEGTTLVQVVDLTTAGLTYPVVADPFLGIRLIGSVRPVQNREGLTYSIEPTAFGRAARTAIHIASGWPEVRSKGVPQRTGLQDQYVCHPASGIARIKSRWNLDTWRPSVGLFLTMARKCNP